jgi:RNA polymerase sigma-70 factor (ECF subfamily)
MNEQLLVAQLKDTRTAEQGFKTLMSLYKKRLYWHIRNMVFNHDDADDILQETFIKVYKNIDSFKGESKLYSWLYRIATNESINFLNKKAKTLQMDNLELQDYLIQNLKTDVYFEGDDIQLKLHKAIATLPDKQQLVFKMRYFEEMKYEEISEILETSVGALKANYHHAAKKIEQFIVKH